MMMSYGWSEMEMKSRVVASFDGQVNGQSKGGKLDVTLYIAPACMSTNKKKKKKKKKERKKISFEELGYIQYRSHLSNCIFFSAISACNCCCCASRCFAIDFKRFRDPIAWNIRPRSCTYVHVHCTMWKIALMPYKARCGCFVFFQSKTLDKHIFLICPQKHTLWVLIKVPHLGTSNDYIQDLFLTKINNA